MIPFFLKGMVDYYKLNKKTRIINLDMVGFKKEIGQIF